LAKASLGGGINHELLKVLLNIRQASPVLADDLFRAALTVARRDSRNASLHVATLAAYALPEFTIPAAPVAPGGATDVAVPGGTPLIREFLDFAADTFLQLSGVAAQLGVPGATAQTAAPNPVDMMTGQRLLPSFVRYMPGKAAVFRQALDTMARHTTRNQETAGLNKLFQSAGTDELLEQAQSERNAHLKDLLYVRAAMSAATGEDFEQALSIIGKLEDAERRVSFDSVLRFQAASASLRKDDVDAALRYAKGVADLRQRAFLYGRIARSLLDKDDVGRATETLNDAELFVAKADDSAIKANALIVLAEVKSRLNPAQGFELLETAVKTFNRADSSEAQQSQVTAASSNPVTTMMLNAVFKLDAPNFEPVFSRLAKVDFNRAAQLARTFERKDRSVSAQIAVCRSVLAVKPTKTIATALGSEKRH
jgi:hypothetical protein